MAVNGECHRMLKTQNAAVLKKSVHELLYVSLKLNRNKRKCQLRVRIRGEALLICWVCISHQEAKMFAEAFRGLFG